MGDDAPDTSAFVFSNIGDYSYPILVIKSDPKNTRLGVKGNLISE